VPIKANVRLTREQRNFVPCACKQALDLEDIQISRLEWSHYFRLLRSWVRDENSSAASLEANVRLVSLAYILTSDRRLQFGRSLMYNRNRRGPRIEP